MKFTDLERVNEAAKAKKYFEHAAECMGARVIVTLAFRGETEKRGGQVQLTLDEQTAAEFRGIFNRTVDAAVKELTLLGVTLCSGTADMGGGSNAKDRASGDGEV